MARDLEEVLNENAQKWVKMLESDRLLHGKGGLHVDDRFCPMGGGCETYRLETGEGYWAPRDSGLRVFHSFVLPGDKDPLEAEFSVLPTRVQTWLGLQSPTGSWDSKLVSCAGSITALNDTGEGDVWGKIINLIKSEPAGLFIKE